MQRRQLLALAGLLGGCGFQLRGDYRYAFNSIQLRTAGATPSLVMSELHRALGKVDGMQVMWQAHPGQSPQVILELIQDQREKTAVGLSVAGQVREFELRQRIRLRLSTPQGRVLIDDAEIVQARQISYNESAALAKEVEESQLYRDMQSDLVSQILRRLSTLKGI
jgi:LPS-assembly lipoprotein